MLRQSILLLRHQIFSSSPLKLTCCCSNNSSTTFGANFPRPFSHNTKYSQFAAQNESANIDRKTDKNYKYYEKHIAGKESVKNAGFDGTEPVVIYEGGLSGQLKRLKLFSMSTSAMGLMMQPLLLTKLNEVGYGPLIAAFTLIGFFTYGTPLLIHFMAKRYVTEIIYNPINDKYTAATYSFFLRRKELEFSADDVIVPDLPGPLTTFHIKSSIKPGKVIPIFTMDSCFLYMEHYGRLMKFDQPVDLHLGDDSTTGTSKKQ